MNDLDLLAFALAEEAVRRKRLELENVELRRKVIELTPKDKESSDAPPA